jgi:hypothetical protein
VRPIRKIAIALVLFLMLSLSAAVGCGRLNSNSTIQLITSLSSSDVPMLTSSAVPILTGINPAGTENSDDVVNTPEGPVYREVDFRTEEVTIGEPSKPVQITYRSHIETKAGQTRNDIFYLDLPKFNPYLAHVVVTFGVVDQPSEMQIIQEPVEGMWIVEPPTGTSAVRVLQISVPMKMKPGTYAFALTVSIQGETYGKVPCTINVLGD